MKTKFTKKDVGTTIKFMDHSVRSGPLHKGLIVEVDSVEPEFAKVYCDKKKKLLDVYVAQVS